MKFIKWLKNYWYYYKVPFIIIVSVIAVGIIMALLLTERVEYDCSVYLCVSENASSEFVSALGAAVSQYADDENGDGETRVQVINLSYDFASPDGEEALAKSTLLAGEMQAGGHFVFFYDDNYYERALGTMFEQRVGLPDKSGTAVDISGSELEGYIKTGLATVGFDPDTLPQLYMSMRQRPRDESKMDAYTVESALFDKLLVAAKK